MFVYKYFMDVYFVYCVIDLPNLCATSQKYLLCEVVCNFVLYPSSVSVSKGRLCMWL